MTTPALDDQITLALVLHMDVDDVLARFASEIDLRLSPSDHEREQHSTEDDVNRRDFLAAGAGFLMSPVAISGLAATPRALARAVADEAFRWGDLKKRAALPDLEIGKLQDVTRQLTRDYINTAEGASCFAHALLHREHLVRILELHRPRPRDAMELHRMHGAVCLLLASISHDHGEAVAGITFTQAAEASGHLAEHHELQHWSLCTRAMIALWQQRYTEVITCAEQADALGVGGAAAVRLKGLQVRAAASMGMSARARGLLRDFERAADGPDDESALSDLGPLFTFPQSRRSYYAAVGYTLVGSPARAERYMASLSVGQSAPPQSPTWPISWALGRAYLAIGRLRSPRRHGDVEGAAEALTPVLSLPPAKRIQQMSHVLGDVEDMLVAPKYHRTASAAHLLTEVRGFRELMLRQELTV